MSNNPIVNNAAKLARMLRLDTLISASAVPLPLDLTPSLTSPLTSDGNAAAQTDINRDLPASHDSHAAIKPTPPPNPAHAPFVPEPAQDAVLQSLQAARDAIHDSLHHGGSVLPGGTAPSSSNSPVADGSTVAVGNSLAHPLIAGNGDAGAPDAAHAAPLISDPADNRVDQGDLSGDLSNAAHDAQATGNGGALDGVIGSTTMGSTTMGPLDLGTASAAIVALANGPAHSEIAGLLTPILENAATPLTVAAHVATAAEAVTVASLSGAGFDALSGLLSAPSAAPGMVHVANTVTPSFEDQSIHVPIGLDDIVHPAADAQHIVHAALPAAGSGLI